MLIDAFAGFGMDTNDGMLGLVDRRREDLLELLPVGFARAGLDRIIIGIAVHRPELIRELAQRSRQLLNSSQLA